MKPFFPRLLLAVAGSTALTAASAVVPVAMAWGAPAVRLAELPVTAAGQIRLPFVRVPAPLSRSLEAPFPVSHLGVRWVGDEDAPVEVRTAPSSGRWGAWERVAVAHDLSREGRRQVVSGLLRVDGHRLVQARSAGDVRRLRVVAIDAESGPRRLVRALPRAAGAETPHPAVVTRAQWGADESLRRAPPIHAPVTRMVVHHTVTPNDDPDPASTMRAMYAYHVKGNGWDDLGYNYVVDAAGRVYEGRWARAYEPGETPTGESEDGRGVVGAHAEGENVGSVGVAVLGNYTDRAPPQAAVDAVQRLLSWKAERHGVDPAGSTTWASGRVLPTIAGHRDVGSTSCPGDHLHARLPSVRQAVAAAVATARAAAAPGYWVLGRDGQVLPFGRAASPLGGAAAVLAAPGAGVASTPSGLGYWVVTDQGRVLPFGDAVLLGSPELLGVLQPAGRAVAIEATPSGLGYWVAEEGGRVRAFGDAPDLGPAPAAPVAGLARTPTGRGYWLAAAGGRVSAHGDARDLGSAAGRVRAPVAGIAATPTGRGYWVAAEDGAVVGFGDARRAGGLPERGIRARVVDIRASASGRGYYLLGEDGAVFSFGDAVSYGAPTGRVTGAALAVMPAR